MYHMLTGKVPFAEAQQKTAAAASSNSSNSNPPTTTNHSRWDYLSIIHAHLARAPPDVTRNRKDLHPAIPTIIAKLMHKNPRQR
jgi:hypothetical protein